MRGLNAKGLLVCLAGLVLALGVIACDDDDDDGGGDGGEASLDLVIGNSIPLTGQLADLGPAGEKGGDLAVDQINQAIQQAGVDHTVTIVHEDNETKPQPAVQAARKLVDSDGASCVVGAWASTDTISTAQSVTIPEGVLQITPASTADGISELDDDGLVNRTSPPDKFQGPTLAKVIGEDLGGAQGKTVNVGARNDDYGEGLAGTFSSGWEDLGGTIGQEVLYDPEQPSYDSEAQQIVSGNPDAIVMIDYPEPFVTVAPALQRTGNWDPTTGWGADGLADSDVTAGVPANVIEGMRGTFPGAPEGGPSVDAFEKLWGSEREVFDAQQFDATILCYLAAVAAGSTDGQEMADALGDLTRPPGTKYTFQQLPEVIAALQNGDDIDYEGTSGAIDLTEEGDATSKVYDLYRFTGGDIDIYGETPIVIPEE